MAAIAFDLDGTLIDSVPDIQAVANAVLSEEARPLLSLEETREFVGEGTGVFVAKMSAARDLAESEHARLLRAFMERYETAVTRTVLYSGVSDCLDALRAQGHALGVCTNKPIAPTRAVLNHLGLSPYFDAVYGGDSLPQRKPDPAPLEATFQALGAGPRLFVGDSEVDGETARRANVPFLLYTEGYRNHGVDQIPHKAQFSDFAELAGLIASI